MQFYDYWFVYLLVDLPNISKGFIKKETTV